LYEKRMWQTCTSELSADAVDASRRSSESKVPMMPCLKQVTHVNYSFILSPCGIEILLFNCVTPLEARLQMEVCGNGKAYAAKTTYVALRDSKRHANITPGLFNYEERGFQKGQRLLTAAGVRIVPKNCKKLQKNISPEPHD
jgi:hypothetical protein